MTLKDEPTAPWASWTDRLLTWGLIVVIPLVALLGFGLLTSVKHAPPGTPMKGSDRVVAAPEAAAGPPTVTLAPASASPCAAAADAKDRPCEAHATNGRNDATIH